MEQKPTTETKAQPAFIPSEKECKNCGLLLEEDDDRICKACKLNGYGVGEFGNVFHKDITI